MNRRFERALDSAWILYAACAISLLLGLFFIFVWAPHPWGWEGFDHYHDIAIELAHGRPFPTMEVPWGYAYFLAAFYRAFGVHPWIPLIVQSALNALTPLLVFVARAHLVRPPDRRAGGAADGAVLVQHHLCLDRIVGRRLHGHLPGRHCRLHACARRPQLRLVRRGRRAGRCRAAVPPQPDPRAGAPCGLRDLDDPHAGRPWRRRCCCWSAPARCWRRGSSATTVSPA